MRGQQVVLDSSNLDSIIADAVGQQEPVELPMADMATTAKEAAKAAEPVVEAADDEGDDETGLTAEERKDLTAKMQKAIGKKHRALKESEEFAAAQYNERRLAESRAETLERELNRLKAQAAPAKEPAAPVKPERNSFATEEEFQNALIDHRVEERLRAREAETAQKQEQERFERMKQEAGARVDKARELVTDYDEVTGAVNTIVPPHVAAYMQESDMIAELGYHFAKNPEALERLQKMTPHKALVEIGKIESTLKPFGPDSAKPEKVPPVVNAPAATAKTALEPSQSKPRAAAPITPLSTGSDSQVEKSPRDRTYLEEREAFQREKGVKLLKRQRH